MMLSRHSHARRASMLASLATLCCVGAVLAGPRNHAQPPANEWPTYGGDWGNTRYSTLKAIDTTNVRELGGAWMLPLKGESSTTTPIVENGVMYIVAGVHVYALDARDGKTRWAYTSKVALGPRGVALGDGLVFVGTRDGSVQALEQANG
jgi:quinohemoprotein ethanol dehydrogenase